MKFDKISVHKTPERSPGFLLWHVSTSWRSAIEAILKGHGLTHPQFVILAALGWLTQDGTLVTQGSVGKMAGLDPNTTSQIIKGLEQKALIHRKQSSDGRAKNPILSSKGKEILAQALPAVEKADGKFFDSLTTKDMTCMIDLFQKLAPQEEKSEANPEIGNPPIKGLRRQSQ